MNRVITEIERMVSSLTRDSESVRECIRGDSIEQMMWGDAHTAIYDLWNELEIIRTGAVPPDITENPYEYLPRELETLPDRFCGYSFFAESVSYLVAQCYLEGRVQEEDQELASLCQQRLLALHETFLGFDFYTQGVVDINMI